MSDSKVGRVLSIVGKGLIDVGSELGISGLALQAVGALARKAGKLIEAGASVDEILKGMETFADLRNPFRVTDGDSTARETPSAKKKP